MLLTTYLTLGNWQFIKESIFYFSKNILFQRIASANKYTFENSQGGFRMIDLH